MRLVGNGRDDPKHQLAPRDYLKMARQGAERAAAKMPGSRRLYSKNRPV